MFGFFCCAFAAGAPATPKSAATVANTRLVLQDRVMNILLLTNSNGQTYVVQWIRETFLEVERWNESVYELCSRLEGGTGTITQSLAICPMQYLY